MLKGNNRRENLPLEENWDLQAKLQSLKETLWLGSNQEQSHQDLELSLHLLLIISIMVHIHLIKMVANYSCTYPHLRIQ